MIEQNPYYNQPRTEVIERALSASLHEPQDLLEQQRLIGTGFQDKAYSEIKAHYFGHLGINIDNINGPSKREFNLAQFHLAKELQHLHLQKLGRIGSLVRRGLIDARDIILDGTDEKKDGTLDLGRLTKKEFFINNPHILDSISDHQFSKSSRMRKKAVAEREALTKAVILPLAAEQAIIPQQVVPDPQDIVIALRSVRPRLTPRIPQAINGRIRDLSDGASAQLGILKTRALDLFSKRGRIDIGGSQTPPIVLTEKIAVEI